MKVGINISIDVTKVDKSKLKVKGSAKYLEMTTFVDIDNKDQYDQNGFISENVSKEERDNGAKGKILGNCKVFWSDGSSSRQEPPKPAGGLDDLDFDDDSIPF